VGSIWVVVATLLLSAPVYALEGGRIGVLYIGCIARSHPSWEMRLVPLFSLCFAHATLRDWASLVAGRASVGLSPVPTWGESAVGQLLPREGVIDTWIEYPRGGLRPVID